MSDSQVISSSEQVIRVLHEAWIVDGQLQLNAFTLRKAETYISVNRPAIDSFSDDICDFIDSHSGFKAANDSNCYQRALLCVGDVRDVSVVFKDKVANLKVEVEPRDFHYKSHAGIFTCVEGRRIKGGMVGEFEAVDGQVVSYDDILLKVQYKLVDLSQIELCQIPDKSR